MFRSKNHPNVCRKQVIDGWSGGTSQTDDFGALARRRLNRCHRKISFATFSWRRSNDGTSSDGFAEGHAFLDCPRLPVMSARPNKPSDIVAAVAFLA